ncbi:amidohydrolase [Sporolituus thermophilus]|uniref:Amidohydrolase n=1 Tax=Sporolituus thermophilus DSM 23256 TaxID=1123285 RepID=A0A1G7HTL2_9FIRM|nr:amidohydrolase [Sporolituus thermophilus]SDF03574.1 amidohydrolase [Sporolituus thermophilus DSM 23256]
MTDLATRVKEVWATLHEMPEVGFEEVKTSAFLADALRAAGYQVQTGVGGTGVVGVLDSGNPGPVLALRADMDALGHMVEGKPCAIHSCGHDAHSAMVLTVAEELARKGIERGKLKILFQPAEEKLFGALRVIEDGAIDDVEMVVGIHLRPIQEARSGQATPALYHGASYIMEATIHGLTAHGARPHLGINAIDAAAAAVNAVNAIHMNPTIPATVKVTKLHAGGAALNAIPDKAVMALDLRSQDNGLMDDLIKKTTRAIEAAAATVGATAEVKVSGGCPAAEYDKDMVELAKEAITAVLGPDGLLAPITTPGGEDFHFFVKHKPSIKAAYIGLGADAAPGLHHQEMKFNPDALINGVNILLYMVDKLVGIRA